MGLKVSIKPKDTQSDEYISKALSFALLNLFLGLDNERPYILKEIKRICDLASAKDESNPRAGV